MKNKKTVNITFMEFCITAIIFLYTASVSWADNPVNVFPPPQKYEQGKGVAVISDGWGILQDKKNADNPHLVAYLSERISHQFGLELRIDDIVGAGNRKRISFGNLDARNLPVSAKEGYVLNISPDSIEILSGTPDGAFRGIQTLCQLIRRERGKVYVSSCKITDYPRIEIRAVHFSGINPDKIKQQIERVARLKYNMVIIESQVYFDLGREDNRVLLEDIFRFARERYIEPVPEVLSFASAQGILTQDPHTAEGIRIENREFRFIRDIAQPTDNLPFANVIIDGADEVSVKSKDLRKTYTKDKDYKVALGNVGFPFRAATLPARITRTPDSRIRGGEEVLVSYTYIENKPSFDFPDSSLTYCPSSEKTYAIMSRTIENVLDILKPAYISIGHDEIRGMNRDKRCRERNLSNAEILSEDINRLYGIIKNIDSEVQVLIWNDMLNPYYNGGNPDFNSQYEGLPGKTYTAIDSIPNDIILMTAAYDPNKSFCVKSSNYFDSKQFKYLVASWKNKQNINEWVEIAKGRKNCLGIIETTWYDWEGNFDNIKYAAGAAWH